MTQEHTKGPWHTDVSDQGYSNGHGPYVAVFDDSGRTLLHVFCTDSNRADRPYQANARLIAAAPDLLEALEAAVEWNGYDDYGIRSVWLKQALSAIAKAKGGAE